MTADLTRALLQRAIRQVVANFPVYRTYLDFAGPPAEADRRDIAWAMTRARRSDPDVHPSAFDFLQNTLMAETEKPPTQELSHTAALRFAMKVQQFSGPVMAKGVEDTAFYRYNRFVALNEVGGAPERFGLAPPCFTRPTPRAPKIGRTRCWRPRRTTPSAARTIGRGSLFSPKCRTNGAGRSKPGVASCERDVATWSAQRRPTATTNICSTRCSWLVADRHA